MNLRTAIYLLPLLPVAALADINSGLVAEYTFDGNGNNSAGSGLNLTAHSATYTTGLFGQAAAFNGNTSYFQTTDNFPITGNGSRTVDVWLNANSYWNYKNILQWGTWNAPGNSWALCLLPPSQGEVFQNSHWVGFASTPTPNAYGTGQWFNLGEVYDGSTRTVSFYINGTYVGGALAIGDASNVNTASGLLTVGNIDLTHTPYSDVWYSPWDGLMDDLRIYNRTLSASEMAQLATVPEPASLSVVMLALLTFGIRRNAIRRCSCA
ncbi:MAG: LamG-like jellyroll fold domain-containing protein [Verrucomicrobiota bacterium]